MRTSTGVLAILGLIALGSAMAPSQAAAQAPPAAPAQAQPADPGQAAPAQKAETASGELRAVDATAKTLTISAGGKDRTFQYTEQTRVTGAQGGVAGLASMSGQQVTVQFTMQGANSVATSIEIAAPKK